MLQKLNERIQGMIAWIVIVLIALTFALFGVDYYLQAHHDAQAAVEVNGQPILSETVKLSYRRLKPNTAMTTEEDTAFKQNILHELIMQRVTLQAANTNGFQVDASQANAAILSIPQFQTDGHFSSQRYAQALSNALFTPAAFQQEVQQGMTLNQQRFALIGTEFVLPNELAHFIEETLQKRSYDTLTLPVSAFMNQVTVSEDAIKAAYQHDRHLHLTPEKVSIDYVLLSMQDLQKKVHITPEQVKQYHEENPTKKPFAEVKAKIEKQLLLEALQSTYASMLDQLSELSYETPDTLKPVAQRLNLNIEHSSLFDRKGGDTPITQNTHVLQAAFSPEVLAQGNNSAPIPLDDEHVVVLRVHQHQPRAEQPLTDVYDKIKQRLAHQQAAEKAMQWGEDWLQNPHSPLLPGITWHAVIDATRDSTQTPERVHTLAFRLPQVGSAAGTVMPSGDYVLVRVQKIQAGNVKHLKAAEITPLRQHFEADEGSTMYELYVHDLLNKAHIVMHEAKS